MSIHIELEPEEERVLRERADRCGRDLPGYVRLVLREHLQLRDASDHSADLPDEDTPCLDDLIDREAVASCEREADDGITLERVRAATSTIKGSMARVVIEDERAERL